MKQTIDRQTIINRLNFINSEISQILNYADDYYTATEEKRLNLLLANKTAYCKMLSKTITKPVGPISHKTGNGVEFRTYNGYFIK